jgi:tetratricopeptide (TPR) repeat protein
MNEPKMALTHFDRFLSLEPQHARSIQVARIMCSIDSTGADSGLGDPVLQEALARSMAVRDPEQRRKVLLQLAQRHPHSPMPLFLIAKTYERERDYGKAIDMYEGALERGPTCGPCHQSLGELLLKKGKKQEAEVHLNKAKIFSNQTLPSSETGGGDSEGTSSGGDSSGV